MRVRVHTIPVSDQPMGSRMWGIYIYIYIYKRSGHRSRRIEKCGHAGSMDDTRKGRNYGGKLEKDGTVE